MKLLAAVLVAAAIAASGCSSGLSPEARRGEALVEELGCTSCHTSGIGPSWVGEWGTSRLLADGSTAVMDERYARRAIADPSIDVVKGYDPVMPSYSLDAEQMTAIIAYLEAVQ